jgi:arylsulfatase A
VGKVSTDLIDSTDFLPTICEAAGVSAPSGMPIDGRSFLAQVRGEVGHPRDWIYSWYSPHGEPPREFAFNHSWKLYRNGEVFDLAADPQEKSPIDRAKLSATAKAEVEQLAAAIAGFANARPADMASTAGEVEQSKLERPRKRAKAERRQQRAARGNAN